MYTKRGGFFEACSYGRTGRPIVRLGVWEASWTMTVTVGLGEAVTRRWTDWGSTKPRGSVIERTIKGCSLSVV